MLELSSNQPVKRAGRLLLNGAAAFAVAFLLAVSSVHAGQPAVVYVDDDYANNLANDSVNFPDDGAPGGGGIIVGVNAFATIQGGVDAVMDPGTVNVAAGSYNELATVNKSLTILGAQAGVDGFTRNILPALESIGIGASGTFALQANGIVLDGFTVQGTVNGSPQGAGIFAAASASGYQIRNNIIRDNIIGLHLQSNGVIPTVVERNRIADNDNVGPSGGTGLFSQNGLSNATIRDNLFTGVNATSNVINTVNFTNVTNTVFTTNTFDTGNIIRLFNVDNSTISNNAFSGVMPGVTSISSAVFISTLSGAGCDNLIVTGNSFTPRLGGAVFANSATALTISSNTITQDVSVFAINTSRAMVTLTSLRGTSNISENTVTFLGVVASGAAVNAIGVQGNNTETVNITGNTLNGANADTFTGTNDSAGIAIFGSGLGLPTLPTAVNVTNNFIARFVNGIDVSQELNVRTTVTIRENDLTANSNKSILGNSASTSTIVNASANWFGSTALPSVQNNIAPMSARVDFTPYLNLGTDISAAPGFQGDLSTLTVHNALEQSGSVGRIQEGINFIADGSLTGSARNVLVLAGTYTAPVDINKAVTLRGAQEGVDALARFNTPGVETVIDGAGQSAPLVIGSAAGAVIDGFVIQNSVDISIRADAAIIVRNNDILGTGGSAAIQITGTGAQITRNLINKRMTSSSTEGISLVVGASMATISSNDISNTTVAAIGTAFSNSASITNNTILDNNAIGIRLGQGSTATVADNTILDFGGIGLRNDGSAVNAEFNFWGDQTGPFEASRNPSGFGSTIDGSNAAAVDFSPWLGDGTDTSAAIGFQPSRTLVFGLASQLVFTTQPSLNNTVNRPLLTQPVVEALDENGNRALSFNGPVTLVLFNNPTGAALTGSNTVFANSGVATFSDVGVNMVGTGYTLRATGGGAAPAISTAFNVSTVTATTTSNVTSSAPGNTSVFGEPVTFTATVTTASGLPTGTVEFHEGGAGGPLLGSANLVNQGGTMTASFTTSTLSVMAHTGIVAVYLGDATFAGSSSAAPLTHTVTAANTTTTLSSNNNPSEFGSNVRFTATVTANAPGAGTPTGTVTFEDGATILGTVTLTNGQASIDVSTLAAGSHNIVAKYNGDVNFLPSSASVTQVVNAIVVTVKAINNLATEDGSVPGVFTIERTSGSSAAQTINFTITGQAIEGVDFVTIGTTVTIPAGQNSVDVTVTGLADNLFEGSEKVILTLLPGAGYEVGVFKEASVTILDEDRFENFSNFSANPNPALVNQNVLFSVITNAQSATYSWNFGDGTTATTTTNSITHAYSMPLVTTATVTISDLAGPTMQYSLTMVVSRFDTDVDTDGDGVSDGMENLAGTDPNNPNSVSVTNGRAPLDLNVIKLATTLSFNRSNKDTVTLVGFLNLPVGYSRNKVAIVDVGGILYKFSLDMSGRARNFDGTMAVAGLNPLGLNRFSIKLFKGNFADKLADEGMTNRTVTNFPTRVVVKLIFDDKLYYKLQPQFYTATQGVKGRSK